MKKCTLCNLEKELNCFGTNKLSKDGHHSRCNPCRAEQRREYVATEKGRQTIQKYKENFPIKLILTKAKSRAKKLGLTFDLDESDIVIPEKCPLLNIPLIRTYGHKASPNTPSIDRIDSKKGYIKGNVWIVSFKANATKSNCTLEELEMIVNSLRNKLQSS